MPHWQHDEGFWIDLQAVLFDDARLAGTREEIDGILSLTGILPPATVLDLACGLGRHSLELARRGYRVTGVDECTAYLEQAEQGSEEEGLHVEWVEADMHLYTPSDPADLILCLYSSIGYRSEADDRQLMATAYSALRPDGALVIELMSQETFVEGIVTKDSFREGDTFIDRRIFWDGAGLVRMDWEVRPPDERVRRYPTEFRLYNREELVTMLRETGFGDIDSFGSLHGSHFSGDSEMLVLLARKPRKGARCSRSC